MTDNAFDLLAWMELSDDELRARLAERGYVSPILDWFLEERDDDVVADAITGILGRD